MRLSIDGAFFVGQASNLMLGFGYCTLGLTKD